MAARRILAVTLAVCVAIAGCAKAPAVDLSGRAVTPDGAIRVSVPPSIGTGYLTVNTSPVISEGVLFQQGTYPRLRITASVTALRELEGDSYADPDLVRFRELVRIVHQALPPPVHPAGCHLVSTRPVQQGQFYGQLEQWQGCLTGSPFWARIAALRADRAVTVTVEVWTSDDTAALVASTVLGQLVVDPALIPKAVNQTSISLLG